MRSLTPRLKQLAKRALRPHIQSYGIRTAALFPQQWGLTDRGAGLALHGVPLASLVRKWGSPLHVVDAQALQANAARFLRPGGQPSGCEVYYSYKTNPVPGVLQQLHARGIGAEVISHYELWLARRLGIAPEHIVYNGPGKSMESLRDAIGMGVQILNINHAEEVARVAAVARALGRKPRVGLRVVTGEGWSAQFGAPIAGGAALQAYRDALATGVLDVVGIHVHSGGMIHSRDALLRGLTRTLDFVAELEATLGITLEILNFGGSLATPTVDHISARDWRLNQTFQRELPEPLPDHGLQIEDYVVTLMATVRSHYAARGRTMPRVFLEPGRAMTGNTQMLVASVMSSKRVSDAHYLILDAGINLAESVRSEYHKIFAVQGWNAPAIETYTLVGPICSPGDTLRYAWRARALAEGEHVVIMDAGAYFVPFSTSFSYPQPGIVMIEDGADALIRRAERFEDIIDRDLTASKD